MPASIFGQTFCKLTLALCGLAAIVQAAPFTSVVVYGDSLSDNGNLFKASGGSQPPDPPYYQGRRSDGPVAVEQLATFLNVPLLDFAWAGATTGVGNFGDGGTPTTFGGFSLPGMSTVFDATKDLIAPILGSQGLSLSDGLFVVWAGPDDFLAPSPLDLTPEAIINRALANQLAIISGLRARGAVNILVPGIPDMGLTPYFKSLGPGGPALGTALSEAYNTALKASLPPGAIFNDTSSLLHAIITNPSAFGLSNVTDPCFDGVSVCADPSKYLFYDDFHPTAAASAFTAQSFLASAVPEPSTLILSVICLGGVGLFSRRKRPAR